MKAPEWEGFRLFLTWQEGMWVAAANTDSAYNKPGEQTALHLYPLLFLIYGNSCLLNFQGTCWSLTADRKLAEDANCRLQLPRALYSHPCSLQLLLEVASVMNFILFTITEQSDSALFDASIIPFHDVRCLNTLFKLAFFFILRGFTFLNVTEKLI